MPEGQEGPTPPPTSEASQGKGAATAPKEALPGKMGQVMAELKKKDQELDGGLVTDLGQKEGFLILQRPISTTDDTSDARRYTEVYDYLVVARDGFKILRADTERNTGLIREWINSWIQKGSSSDWAEPTQRLAQAINRNDKDKIEGYMARWIKDPRQEEIAKIMQTNIEAAKKEKDQKEAAKLANEAQKIADAEAAKKPETEKLAAEETKKQEDARQAAAQAQTADSVLDMLGKS